MASVSEKNGNSVSGGKPERGGLTGSGTGLEPKPIRVSVIDDDPMICQAMSLILNDYSHGRIEVVSTSTDGETCVRRAAEEKPDVVLMDIAMPGVDGIEATRLLRSLSPAPHVLILTSLSPSGTVERAVEAPRAIRTPKSPPACSFRSVRRRRIFLPRRTSSTWAACRWRGWWSGPICRRGCKSSGC